MSGRVAVSGRATPKEFQNLLVRSEEFDDASWSLLNASVSRNVTTGPFGAQDADALVDTAANVQHRIGQGAANNSGKCVALSVWAKAAARSWMLMAIDNTNQAWFNLATGAVGTVQVFGNGPTNVATIDSYGSGWYRCTIARQWAPNSNQNVYFWASTADGSASYLGDGTAAIYLYGAQFCRANWAGAYQITTAATVDTGPIRNLRANA
jgi:hypothetical protein